VVVVGLRAPLELIHARVRSREAGDPGWFLDAATNLVERLRDAGVADHMVDNDGRSPSDVAREALRLTGWLAS
jgi:chloramphenicol 3-O-phosphotransferase